MAAPTFACAQALALYDDFGTPPIDRDKWRGFEHVIPYAPTASLAGGWHNWVEDEATTDPALSVANEVAIRGIAAGRLRLALTSHGAASEAGVTPGVGRLGMRMRPTPGEVSRLQARVTIVDAAAEPCATEPSRGRAQILGHFVSDGDEDVFASLALEHRSSDENRIVAVVSRCRDASCTTAEDLDFVVFARSWAVGGVYALTITHQPDRNRFVFAVTGGGETGEARMLAYPAPAAPGPPRLAIRDLRVENGPAFCPPSAGGITRARVTTDARFDDVRVNASALVTP